MSHVSTYFRVAAEVIGSTLTPASRSSPEIWRIKIIHHRQCLCLHAPERQQLDIWLPCVWAGVRPLYEHIHRICGEHWWKTTWWSLWCFLARVGQRSSYFIGLRSSHNFMKLYQLHTTSPDSAVLCFGLGHEAKLPCLVSARVPAFITFIQEP